MGGGGRGLLSCADARCGRKGLAFDFRLGNSCRLRDLRRIFCALGKQIFENAFRFSSGLDVCSGVVSDRTVAV